MSELPDDWTDEERAILRSAEDDVPSAGSVDKTLAALGVGTAVGLGAGAAKATGLFLVAKWLGVAALGAGIAAGGVYATHRRIPPVAVTPPAAGSSPSVPTAAAEPPSAPVVEAPTAAPSSPPAVRSARREPSAPAAQPDIALEIASIDVARKALRAGNSSGAIAELDRYEATFGRAGSLAPEATVLRIEALLARGDKARATALATAFVAAHPKSPLAARVRTLIP
jgi:hypothetical protein